MQTDDGGLEKEENYLRADLILQRRNSEERQKRGRGRRIPIELWHQSRKGLSVSLG